MPLCGCSYLSSKCTHSYIHERNKKLRYSVINQKVYIEAKQIAIARNTLVLYSLCFQIFKLKIFCLTFHLSIKISLITSSNFKKLLAYSHCLVHTKRFQVKTFINVFATREEDVGFITRYFQREIWIDFIHISDEIHIYTKLKA